LRLKFAHPRPGHAIDGVVSALSQRRHPIGPPVGNQSGEDLLLGQPLGNLDLCQIGCFRRHGIPSHIALRNRA
jgi:hypothetical protein